MSWGSGKIEGFLSVTWTKVYCIWLTRIGLSYSRSFVLWNVNMPPHTYTHIYLFLSLVRCCPNKPTLWTSQVGHSLRRNWLHGGRNVDLCSTTGMGTSVPFSERRESKFVLLKVSFSSYWLFFFEKELKMRVVNYLKYSS